MITAVRVDTIGPHLYRQQSSTFCDGGQGNLFANSLCSRRGFVFTRGSSHRRLRDRSTPASPPTLKAMRPQQPSVHQSTSITCSATMSAVHLSCVFVAHPVCDWAGLTVRPPTASPPVWALVHCGCPCRNPPVSPLMPRQDGIGDRVPTLCCC